MARAPPPSEGLYETDQILARHVCCGGSDRRLRKESRNRRFAQERPRAGLAGPAVSNATGRFAGRAGLCGESLYDSRLENAVFVAGSGADGSPDVGAAEVVEQRCGVRTRATADGEAQST